MMISRGDGLIGTLLSCTPKGHEFGIYEARWLQESEEAFAPWAIQECFKDYDTGAIESDFVKMLGQKFTPKGLTIIDLCNATVGEQINAGSRHITRHRGRSAVMNPRFFERKTP
ncbi:MAG: hypothetical protein JO170_04185 [Verrucomicrobia bacterium]|nr:hypothetical protein [Verrucomicrobiota bacterium]